METWTTDESVSFLKTLSQAKVDTMNLNVKILRFR